jgi:Exocyst complex component Sec10
MLSKGRSQNDACRFHCRLGELFLIAFLQHCAQTVLDFNGGASCVQVYVNQHDFFINRVRKDMESDDTTLSVLLDNIYWRVTHTRLDGALWLIPTQFLQKASQV